jgi:hypothetical protein
MPPARLPEVACDKLNGDTSLERRYISEQRYRTAHANLSLAEALVDPNNAAVLAESAAAVGGPRDLTRRTYFYRILGWPAT